MHGRKPRSLIVSWEGNPNCRGKIWTSRGKSPDYQWNRILGESSDCPWKIVQNAQGYWKPFSMDSGWTASSITVPNDCGWKSRDFFFFIIKSWVSMNTEDGLAACFNEFLCFVTLPEMAVFHDTGTFSFNVSDLLCWKALFKKLLMHCHWLTYVPPELICK